MNNLSQKKCGPCSSGTIPFSEKQINTFKPLINPSWTLINNLKLERNYKFPNFIQALAFVNRVGELAEKEGHHPDITLSWGKVNLELMTHKIKGLSENDFILAAKIDELIP